MKESVLDNIFQMVPCKPLHGEIKKTYTDLIRSAPPGLDTVDLNVIKRGLGLSVQNLADVTGLAKRTIQAQLSGENPVSTRIVAAVHNLEQVLDEIVDAELAIHLAEPSSGRPVFLVRYSNPEEANWSGNESNQLRFLLQDAALTRIRRRLIQEGFQVRIIRFDSRSWNEFRQGLTDADHKTITVEDWARLQPDALQRKIEKKKQGERDRVRLSRSEENTISAWRNAEIKSIRETSKKVRKDLLQQKKRGEKTGAAH